jgi:titin
MGTVDMTKITPSIWMRLAVLLATLSFFSPPPAFGNTNDTVLQISGHTGSSVSLTWSGTYSSANLTDYVVEYRRGQSSWVADPRISGLDTTATVQGLEKGVDYNFRVTPVFTNTLGTASNIVTERPSSAPDYPTLTNITNLPSGGFALSWTDSFDGGSPITAYDVYYSSDGLNYSLIEEIPSLGMSSNSYSASKPSGAGIGDSAFFRVLAKNRDGTLDPQIWASFDYEKPMTPTGSGGWYTLNTYLPNCSVTLLRQATCGSLSIPSPYFTYGDIVYFLRGSNPTYGSTDFFHCFLTSTAYRICQSTNHQNGFRAAYSDRNPYPFLAGIVKYPVDAPTISILSHSDKSIQVAVDIGEVNPEDLSYVGCSYSSNGWETKLTSLGNWPSLDIRSLTNGKTYEIKCRLVTGYASDWSNIVSEYPSTSPTAPTIKLTSLSTNFIQGVVDTGSVDYISGGSYTDLNSLQYSVDGLRWFEILESQRQNDGTYSFSLNNLSGDRTYRLRANLVNRDGNSSWSEQVSVIPDQVTAPEMPALRVISHTDSSVELSWTKPLNGGAEITGYVLQYSSDSGSSWTTVQTQALDPISTVVSGLSLGTSYTFRVAALNPVGQGPFSSTVSETPSSVPEVTQLHVKSTSATTVTLGWTGVANGGVISRYKIQYLEPGSVDNWILSSDGVDSATTAVVRGLSPGTTYKFRVSALNRDGQGPFASVFEKPSAIPTVNALTSSTLSETSVRLTWSNNSNGDTISNSLVEYSSDNGNSWTEYASVLPITSTSVDVTGLTKNTEYQFRVSAENRDGRSLLSNVASGNTFIFSAPSAPNLRIVRHSSNSISLSWMTPDNGGKPLNGYVLQYGKTSGDTWTSIYNSGPLNGSYVVTGLIQGQNYRFRVTVSNPVGQSEYSEIVYEKPSSPPSMFALVSQSSTDSSVGLLWGGGNPNGDPITDYKVEYSSDRGGSWVVYEDGQSIRNSTIVTGLTRGTSYLFRVSAENRDGFGFPIAAISASTAPSTQPTSSKLKISGIYKAGSTLTASVFGSLAGSKVTYEWLIDGKKISGKTSSKFTIPKSYVGRKLSIRATISVPRYWPRTISSTVTTIKK